MSTKFEAILAYHCSPALLGIKSANLICCKNSMFDNIEEEIKETNTDFKGKVKFKVIKKVNDSILVLVYQENKLKKILFDSSNNDYLLKLGYPKSNNINDYIDYLCSRMTSINFPHEIGVFLNYDLDDIIEFSSKNKECLFCGYWQVFSDIERKKQIFDKYTRCRNIVTNLISKGYRLETLI